MSRPPKQSRVNTEDSLGLGIEAAVIIALFFGAGFGLDRLFGTTPVLMIVFTILGAVGLFAKFKYRYDDRMAEHEAERLRSIAARSKRSVS
jgi:hypothetical protein